MQCCEPVILPVVSPDGVVTFQFQRCGHCYACQNTNRAQMVVRMKHEMEDSYNVGDKYFFTLTYDDNHLLTPFSSEEWSAVSWYYHNLPIAFRKYDYSLLEPWRLSQFIKDLQNQFILEFCNGFYDDHKNLKTAEKNVYIRYFCTGEYGDISHRAHYHGVIMFPRDVHFMDMYRLVHDNWKCGVSKINYISTVGACNYVAKHQVKECIGSEFQQIASPIFARYSIFGGGIGRCLKNDTVMRDRYLRSLKTRDKSDLFYKTYQNGKMFKVAIPRMLIKAWHPERFSTEELIMSQKEGFENLMQFVFDNLSDNLYLSDDFRDALQFLDWQLENISEGERFTCCNDVDFQNFMQLQAIDTVLQPIRSRLKHEDEVRRKVYVNKHISDKLAAIAGGASDKDLIY